MRSVMPAVFLSSGLKHIFFLLFKYIVFHKYAQHVAFSCQSNWSAIPSHLCTKRGRPEACTSSFKTASAPGTRERKTESHVSAAVSRFKLVVAICLQQWLPGQQEWTRGKVFVQGMGCSQQVQSLNSAYNSGRLLLGPGKLVSQQMSSCNESQPLEFLY